MDAEMKKNGEEGAQGHTHGGKRTQGEKLPQYHADPCRKREFEPEQAIEAFDFLHLRAGKR